MKRGLLAAVLLASSATLIGQQPAPQRAFDVVSIKPSPPGAQNRLPRISPGRVELFNATLKQLIASAYSRFPFDPRATHSRLREATERPALVSVRCPMRARLR
jgi:hypothetical protein